MSVCSLRTEEAGFFIPCRPCECGKQVKEEAEKAKRATGAVATGPRNSLQGADVAVVSFGLAPLRSNSRAFERGTG